MNEAPLRLLTEFLRKLDQAAIHYELGAHREGAVLVSIVVPGAHWEVDFFEDGAIEVERFASDGDICGAEALDELFARYGDYRQPTAPAPRWS